MLAILQSISEGNNVFTVLTLSMSIFIPHARNRRPCSRPHGPDLTDSRKGPGTNRTQLTHNLHRSQDPTVCARRQSPTVCRVGGRSAGGRSRGADQESLPRSPGGAAPGGVRGRWARGSGARGSRLPPPAPPAAPHAHAQLAVAAGLPRAGSVWGDAGTKWQRLGHMRCHC